MIGGFLPLPGSGAPPGIAAVGVLQFSGPRRLVYVQDSVGVRNILPQLPEVARQQSLEKHHGPTAVAERVEAFNGHPVLIAAHPHQAGGLPAGVHRLTKVAHVLLDKGAGAVVGDKIVPKCPFAQTYMKGGKTGNGLFQGPLKSGGVHRLVQHGGDPVDRGVIIV